MDWSSAIEPSALFYALILVLPGFISMRVYSLIRPGDQVTLKDSIFEATAYGAINLGLMYWAVAIFLQSDSIILQSVLAAMVLAIGPVVWPFVLDKALEAAARRGIVKYRYKTAWDDFFSRRKACWLIIHLPDGRRLGGLFGDKSYATLYPTPGHLFVEELWTIDQDTGEFQGTMSVSQGIILKPDDYRFVEVKAYIE